MDFELLRLSLVKRREDLFSLKIDRDVWLRRVLGDTVEFVHRNRPYTFVPQPSDDGSYISGMIGRGIIVVENASPEEAFQLVTRPAYAASAILLDPTHHQDGQKVALQVKPNVGAPLAILNSLVKQINSNSTNPYTIYVETISEEKDFWNFVRENRGNVTSVTFEFFAPNMFDSEDEFDEELRQLREKENAQKVTMKLESPDGLDLETERVRVAANVATRGTGSIKARTRGKAKRFNSKDRGKRLKISENDNGEEKSMIRSLIKAIFSK
ncbi:MAG: hypothetical protein ACT6XS_16990 [Phreatobacter sp.]|uniref:hypothetical protein n=1 Tax=Phreatobacter sp. TaxID=1966341 RepID=UPI0040363498